MPVPTSNQGAESKRWLVPLLAAARRLLHAGRQPGPVGRQQVLGTCPQVLVHWEGHCSLIHGVASRSAGPEACAVASRSAGLLWQASAVPSPDFPL
jgi:hypothetical protein